MLQTRKKVLWNWKKNCIIKERERYIRWCRHLCIGPWGIAVPTLATPAFFCAFIRGLFVVNLIISHISTKCKCFLEIFAWKISPVAFANWQRRAAPPRRAGGSSKGDWSPFEGAIAERFCVSRRRHWRLISPDPLTRRESTMTAFVFVCALCNIHWFVQVICVRFATAFLFWLYSKMMCILQRSPLYINPRLRNKKTPCGILHRDSSTRCIQSKLSVHAILWHSFSHECCVSQQPLFFTHFKRANCHTL